MRIRLDTSKGNGIKNDQQFDVSSFERNWAADIPKVYPQIRPRTEPTAAYNCHGLTFASRRTRIIDDITLRRILVDDNWVEVDAKNVLPGDIVVYFGEENDVNHSGIVVACEPPLYLPVICSKWGSAGEYIHNVSDCPTIYGPIKKFFRCRL